MKKIADTGLLAAALDRSDPLHDWGAAQLREQAPFFTCDGVLVELAFVIDDPAPGLKLIARGDLILDFDLNANLGRILELLDKYRDRRMDLADACLVRMTELTGLCYRGERQTAAGDDMLRTERQPTELPLDCAQEPPSPGEKDDVGAFERLQASQLEHARELTIGDKNGIDIELAAVDGESRQRI